MSFGKAEYRQVAYVVIKVSILVLMDVVREVQFPVSETKIAGKFQSLF